MNKALISSLQALVALADIELCESALAMAEAMDAKSEADGQVRRCEAQVVQLDEMFERLSAPGVSIDVSAIGFLARQSQLAAAQLTGAVSQDEEAKTLLEERQIALHGHHARHEGLSDGLRSAREERARWLEEKAMLEREDLFLIRRHLLEVQA
jgi:hypothetical protein